ncbi:MAG: hypothetical protein QOI26_1218 [Pseudonocardiales bacterium]|nr:hypothetical protein [Pseudonocardiales bacterium]
MLESISRTRCGTARWSPTLPSAVAAAAPSSGSSSTAASSSAARRDAVNDAATACSAADRTSEFLSCSRPVSIGVTRPGAARH